MKLKKAIPILVTMTQIMAVSGAETLQELFVGIQHI